MKNAIKYVATASLAICLAVNSYAQSAGSIGGNSSLNATQASTQSLGSATNVTSVAKTMELQRFASNHPRFDHFLNNHDRLATRIFNRRDLLSDRGVRGKFIWDHRAGIKNRAIARKMHR